MRPVRIKPKQNKSRRVVRLVAALAVQALLAGLYIAGVSRPVVHFDLFHQMALMREALALGYVPTVEQFAYTARVEPAIQHEWGAGLIALLVLNRFGGAGTLAFHYALVALMGAGVFLLARASRARAPLMWAALAAVSYLLTYSAIPVVAQSYSMFFTIALLLFLKQDREGGQRWILAWLPLSVVWGNVHGGVVVGIGIVLAHALEQVLRQRPWKHLAGVAAAMAALLAVSPYGWKIYPFLAHALTAERPIIGEWSPQWMLVLDRYRAGVFLASLAVFAYTVWRRGWRSVEGALIVLLLGLASVRAMKMLPFYALAWLVYVPAVFGRTPMGREIASGMLRNLRWYGAGCLLLLGLAGVATVRQHPFTLAIPNEPRAELLNISYPVGAVEYLKQQGFKGNIMTPYEQGAYVLWKLHPNVKVGMDSRYETAYDMGWVHRAHFAYLDQPPGAWRGVLATYPTDAVLVSRMQPLSERLAEDKGWSLAYKDDVWRVYARQGVRLTEADWSGRKLTGALP